MGARATRSLRTAVQANAETTKVQFKSTGPNVGEYHDLGSGTMSDQITPGNIGSITGYRLKFNPDRTDEGVFLTEVQTNQVRRIHLTSENRPRRLTFKVPEDLADGAYRLHVANRQRNSSLLQTGLLQKSLRAGP